MTNTMVYWIPGPHRGLGRLGISPRPRGGDWLDGEVRAWKSEGVDLVVSLLTNEEARELDLDAEEAVCREHGIDFRSFAIPDRGLPASTAVAIELAAGLAAAVREGKSVVVHCRQGIGRSGIIAAATLVALGRRPDEALVEVERARGRPIPDTEEQRDWVLGLRTDRRGP